MQARGQVPGKTGVWVGERKIGAVGVRITHGISSHGIALNVSTNLDHYRHIVPCGTPDKEVTSLQREWQLGDNCSSPDTIICPIIISSSSSCRDQAAQHQLQQGQATDLLVAEQHMIDALVRVFSFDTVEQITEQQLISGLR